MQSENAMKINIIPQECFQEKNDMKQKEIYREEGEYSTNYHWHQIEGKL